MPDLAGVGVGLPLIALGSGGVKANATSLVGSLYAEDDERRDAGFSLFYMGINIGAFVGPLLTGWLQENKGFHWGFGLAAVGMFLGLVQYSIGRKRLPDESRVVPNPLEPAERLRYGGGAGRRGRRGRGRSSLTGLDERRQPRPTGSSGITVVAAIGYFVLMLTSSQVTAVERSRVWSFVPLFVTNAVFWSLYQQQFTVVDDLLRRAASTATSSAGRCRCRGCSRSTRSSSSRWRRCSPPCGRGSARASRRRR